MSDPLLLQCSLDDVTWLTPYLIEEVYHTLDTWVLPLTWRWILVYFSHLMGWIMGWKNMIREYSSCQSQCSIWLSHSQETFTAMIIELLGWPLDIGFKVVFLYKLHSLLPILHFLILTSRVHFLLFEQWFSLPKHSSLLANPISSFCFLSLVLFQSPFFFSSLVW